MVLYEAYFIMWFAGIQYLTRKARGQMHELSDMKEEEQLLVFAAMVLASFGSKYLISSMFETSISNEKKTS